ncbi:MAG TPA: exopolysaccharide biosynthesis protein [Oleiagrimonas sp.]|nr:exopolysaccharide biosynthesis protein [Oleiagrimonas sp.]
MTQPPDEQRRTTVALLRDAITSNHSDDITLKVLLEPLRSSAFGVVLLVLAIPNFIPLPIGIGGIMGVLVIALGMQMLCGMEHPLIPARLRRKTMHRTRVLRFLERTRGITRRLERWCKPRMTVMVQRPWSLVSGLALVILGLLLSLPIPFTNYVFGVLLLAFAFALIERDGALLLVMWVLSGVLLILALVFSSVVIDSIQQVWQQIAHYF